jgi:serine/threonine protein kinase
MATTDDAALYEECEKALSNKYEVDGRLGKGAFGQVFKVKCKDDGKPYAIKMLPINKIQGAKYEQREVEALTKFQQNRSEESKRNVIEHFKAWILHVRGEETLAIQMELCSVNLHTFVSKNKIDGPKIIQAQGPPRFYRQVFRQILDGLVFIHSMYWVHRDIHPGNILIVNQNPQRINDIHVKIADFGLARYVGTTFDLSSDGTINLKSEELTPFACDALHTAPELNTKTYDFKVDVYSAGMVLYFISCFPVLESSELKEEIKAIRRGERDINKCIYHKDDEKLSSLIKQMIQENPNERPSASEAKKYMFPEAKDSTDGKKAQTIKFFARKKNEDLRTCSLSELTFSALKAEVERRTRTNASQLRQEDTINGEKMRIVIENDEDVENIFENAAQKGRDVVVVVTEKAEDCNTETRQISSGDIMMQSPPETF